MKTITIEIPDLASDEDKILEIINGLEDIEAALDDILYDLDEDCEAAETMEAAVDAVSSAVESLDTTIALLNIVDEDDEDEDEGENEPTSGIHITIEL